MHVRKGVYDLPFPGKNYAMVSGLGVLSPYSRVMQEEHDSDEDTLKVKLTEEL